MRTCKRLDRLSLCHVAKLRALQGVCHFVGFYSAHLESALNEVALQKGARTSFF